MSEAGPLQQVLQRVQPCEVAALGQAAPETAGHAVIVCDVTLDLPETVDRLRAALAQCRQDLTTPVLLLLRDPSHVARGQARLAGATATLAHRAPATELLATVAALIAAAPAVKPRRDEAAEVKAGVKQAGQVLTTLFQCAAAGAQIPAANLHHGGAVLLEAVRQAKIQAWLEVVSTYDDATYQHCLLVAGLTAAFALELGVPPKMQHTLSQAALIHDIGKAKVPRHILNKPGRLTAAEMAVMRSHAESGYRMLAGQPGIGPQLLDVVRYHHEYLDGSGYPDGLQAAHISRGVRIVTICDIYAALIERRAYKKPMPPKLALAYLDSMGPKLDQELVKAFRNVVRET